MTDRQTGTHSHTDTQAGRDTEIQTAGRQKDRQTGRQADRDG